MHIFVNIKLSLHETYTKKKKYINLSLLDANNDEYSPLFFCPFRWSGKDNLLQGMEKKTN